MEQECLLDYESTNCSFRIFSNQKKFTLFWNIENCEQIIFSETLEEKFSFSFDTDITGTCRLGKIEGDLTFEIFLESEFYYKLAFCNNAKKVLHKRRGRSSTCMNLHQPFYFRTIFYFNAFGILPNDELLIVCTLAVEGTKTVKTVKYNPDPGDYLKGLRGILRCGPFLHENVTLRIGEDTESVNKAVLCGNSPLLAAFLRNKAGDYSLRGIEFPVLKNMIAFLNSGILRCDDFESVFSLYSAANEYDIKKLREACSQWLAFKLNVRTVCRVLVLSKHHQDIELKNHALMFFKDNAENILVTDEWCDLMRDEIKLGLEAIEVCVGYGNMFVRIYKNICCFFNKILIFFDQIPPLQLNLPST